MPLLTLARLGDVHALQVNRFLAFCVAATAPKLVGPIIAVNGVRYLPRLGDTCMTPAKAMRRAAQLNAMAEMLTADL